MLYCVVFCYALLFFIVSDCAGLGCVASYCAVFCCVMLSYVMLLYGVYFLRVAELCCAFFGGVTWFFFNYFSVLCCLVLCSLKYYTRYHKNDLKQNMSIKHITSLHGIIYHNTIYNSMKYYTLAQNEIK